MAPRRGAACCAPTTEKPNHGSGFVEDALVVALVAGMASLARKFFSALMRAIWPISRSQSAGIPNGAWGTPRVFVSREYGLSALFHPPARQAGRSSAGHRPCVAA